ncbi:Alpha/beta hydrolase fold [Trema orientale]|uniref:Alpha/beta hydrolase fold n=1 Tax=Trema orientale TaxID=63057 RepID=A0A2P5AFT8_TREOI|nr:Alpha/beta hydrolase fold [Trema orientale]
MDRGTNQMALEFTNFRIYEDGRIERFGGDETIPLSPNYDNRIPIFVFFHGEAFCAGSPFSPYYTRHIASLAAEENVVALSVRYQKAPEHPLPTAFEDTWDAVQWAVAHSSGCGLESWLNEYANFQRALVGRASADANITHIVYLCSGVNGLSVSKIVGMVLFHPFFGNDEPSKLMGIIFPSSSGPNLGKLGCRRVLVFVAEKDSLRDRGVGYYKALKKSEKKGLVEIVETQGEGNVFHLLNQESDKAKALIKKEGDFFNMA